MPQLHHFAKAAARGKLQDTLRTLTLADLLLGAQFDRNLRAELVKVKDALGSGL